MAFRAGIVAVAGKPNVGKSTLVNKIVGEKVSVVSGKPQTTRKPAEGIANFPHAQIILRDTAGIHAPKTKLGRAMVDLAMQAIHSADLILWVVDVSHPADSEDKRLAKTVFDAVNDDPNRVVVALNKMDHLRPENVELHYGEYAALAKGAKMMYTNALTGENVNKLCEILIQSLPEGEPFFDDPSVYTSEPVRGIVSELIREQVLKHTRDEIPHAVAVRIEEWREPDAEHSLTLIRATLVVERESQRPILIGHNGEMIKQIGSAARREIEALIGAQVFLDLHVKVARDWRNSPIRLRELGLI